jgi:lysozyme|tara:strand:+ start:3929 stop:4354 length:426 start_codon:yes stop_codon:yes gene_type:complete
MIPKELQDIVDDIKKHEGFEPKVYECTEGYETIGYGFAIKDLVIDKDVADLILMKKLHTLLQRILIAFPWFKDIDDRAKSVVINMCYQLGIRGFSKFKKTIYYLETEQYEEASMECLDSLWAKQTPGRAKDISEQLACLAD